MAVVVSVGHACNDYLVVLKVDVVWYMHLFSVDAFFRLPVCTCVHVHVHNSIGMHGTCIWRICVYLTILLSLVLCV